MLRSGQLRSIHLFLFDIDYDRVCAVALVSDCDFDTADEAIKNGADCLTHIYNAMPPFHHRNPGPIGAGFVNHIYAQIICDGFHISKRTKRLPLFEFVLVSSPL